MLKFIHIGKRNQIIVGMLTFAIILIYMPNSVFAEFGTSKYLQENTFSGKDTGEATISLEEVLQSVANTNPEIKEALNQYKSVKSERLIATSGYKPTFGAELIAGPEYTDGVPTNDKEETFMAGSATIYARQNIYQGGATDAFTSETDARIKSAAYEVLNVANRIFLETSEAYINVLQAKEQVKMSENNVLTQIRILKQIKEKTDSGFGRISDLTNSESRLALSKGNYISRQQDVNQAISKFHRQFGRLLKPESFISPIQKYQLPDTVETAVDTAFKNHPAIDVAKYNILARKYSHKKAKAAYYPTIDLELKAQHRENTGGDEGTTDQASAMIKFNYTFYDGGTRKGETQKNYNYLLKEYQKSYTERRNVNESVRLAWDILSAEESKREFLTDHVALSKKTLGEFVEEYHLGRRTLLEILDMEKEHYNANSSYVQSKYSFLIAYYRALQAMGAILHEFDTNILDKVNMSQKKEAFDMAAYNGLEMDIDKDKRTDLSDQCDNSIFNTKTGISGCLDEKESTLGYKSPKNITPYIVTSEPELLPLVLAPEGVFDIDHSKKVQSFNMSAISFKYNSSQLTKSSKSLITKIANQLKTLDNYSLEVIGHTDSQGSAKYNTWLSKRRANSVVKILVAEGIDISLIKSIGAGEKTPIASNKTKSGRKENRRTEFKLTMK